jgi:hypothetical protein
MVFFESTALISAFDMFILVERHDWKKLNAEPKWAILTANTILTIQNYPMKFTQCQRGALVRFLDGGLVRPLMAGKPSEHFIWTFLPEKR